MGNMMPCLVRQGTTALAAPAMSPKQRLYSLNLLVKALHKMKKRPGTTGSNSKAKIGSESSSSSSSSVADGKGGGGGQLEVKIRANSNPKGHVLRSRLHGGQKKKGVVRVKVVLTKEEAARLLSLTVGGHKTAAQIVAEIKRMEARRAAATAAGWRPALESIPEESP